MYCVWPTFLSLRRNILDMYLSLRPAKEIASSVRRHNIYVIKLLCKYMCCTKAFGFLQYGCIGSCWGNRREGDRWGDLGVDGWAILGRITRTCNVGMWTGLGWPRIEISGGRL